MTISKRLSCIAAQVPDGRGLIDVGTDHGYLPLALAARGYPGRLIASDIHAGPLEKARRNAAEAGLAQRIEFRLCDGLDGCEPEAVDSIVIAGMGGDTVCGILDRAEWCLSPAYTLLLQPATHAEVVRYWLVYNGFALLREELVEENGLLYPVLTARYGGETRLRDAELFTGPAALLRGHPLFPRLLERERARFEKSLRSLAKTERGELLARAALLRGILEEIREMQHDDD